MRHPVSVLSLAATLLVSGAFAAGAQAPVPQSEPQRITVVGEGEADGAPDLAHVTLTVLRVAESAAAALADSNTAAAAVADAMRGFGIEARDLQTAGFSITPQYRYENRPDGTSVPPQIIGYEARNTLSVRVRDLPRLGEILDSAVSLGVNQGGDIAFGVDDPTALRNDARRDAVEKARASAAALSQAAGVGLGRIVSITDEGEPGRPIPMRPEMRMMAASADGAVPIEIGESTVGARVRVVFELTDAAPR